jgi:hypothetical protein
MQISTHNVNSDIIATFKLIEKRYGAAVSDIISIDEFTEDDGATHDFTVVTLNVKSRDEELSVKLFS